MNLPKASAIWHPFTQHGLRPRLPMAVGTEGAYVQLADGRRILDAISSWWVITHGHRHPHIMAAIRAETEHLDQVIFAEYTHELAETLANKLVAMTPPGLKHVFFSDSGSTSVEVALKMALGYWHHRLEKRRRVIVLEHSYHGDTIGTMSVGARGAFTAPYEPLLFEVSCVPFPAAGREEQSFEALEALCQAGDAAAFIVETLVLGAGGMLMYSAAVLRRFHEICARHGVLFIADEVMTGWGRTGTRFACEQAGISPDIACYSKGLTGGSIPLAVTLCTHDIYATHLSTDRRKTFFHSSSYTANPIACAAAVANIEIWERDPVAQRIAALCAMQARHLEPFHGDRRFVNVRRTGTIAALDIVTADSGYFSKIGLRLHTLFQATNVLLRPLGNTIYVLPPYCVTNEDLALVYQTISQAPGAIT
jgi:adenosylmethionine-8-amino-7-oxononanoate aminotransferase